MKIRLGKLRAIIREVNGRDNRMSLKNVNGQLTSSDDPEKTALKKDIAQIRSSIAKFEQMERRGKRHGQDIGAMRSHLAELEAKLSARP